MFEDALKGIKRGKAIRIKKDKKMRAFGNSDANRWKKEGSPTAMMKMGKPKF